MNKAILIGRVGKDPEFIEFTYGSLARFSLATTEKYKDKEGQKKESTEWHNIVVNGKLSEVVRDWVKKGMLISVSGKIKYREYEKDGQKRQITEIQVTELDMLSKVEGQESKPTELPTISSAGEDDLPVGDEGEDSLPF